MTSHFTGTRKTLRNKIQSTHHMVNSSFAYPMAYRTIRRQTNLPVSQVADWITRGLVNSPTANF